VVLIDKVYGRVRLAGPLLDFFHTLPFSKKACAILNDSHMSYTVYDRKLFAFVQIAHGHCDELCVIQIISYG
jgi:hypothetical protein